MPSKIEKELTPEEVVELLETLVATPGGHVLRVIQEEAEKRGIQVSLMAASSFRDSALQPFLEQLKSAKRKSMALAEAVTAGDEQGLLAAARTGLAEQVFDFVMEKEPDSKNFGGLAKTLSMLSGSNQADSITQARLREYKVKDEERLAAKAKLEERKSAMVNKGGLSQEAIELMEESLNLLG